MASVLWSPAFNRPTIARGVPAGARIPYQIGMTKLSTPASFDVGTSDMTATRFSDRTASARTLFALIGGIAGGSA